ncbi:DUF354 domain-containing protein [Prevotella brevis]|nr:DUF354 domain-containing protein [Xylanibacter brevis]
MRILIDIGHPAHVHLFRNYAAEMLSRGHSVLFTCRDKEFEIDLLRANNFQYKSFGKKYKTTISKLWGLLKFDYLEWITALKFKPDLFLSHGSPYAAHASKLVGKPHIAFEDTYNFEQIRLYEPFTDIIFTGKYEHPSVSKKEIQLPTYHELGYLVPSRFTPDVSVLDVLGVGRDENYTIVRFVSWEASHDIGHKGIPYEMKVKAVKEFAKYGRVFISSEGNLPQELEPYRLRTVPDAIFDVLAFAKLIWGESSTMSEEAAMLGVPSVYFNNNSTFYTRHLERDYSLIYNLSESKSDLELGINIGVKILSGQPSQQEFIQRRDKMLKERVDLTDFLVWFTENYPKSKFKMKDDSSLLKQFRIKR